MVTVPEDDRTPCDVFKDNDNIPKIKNKIDSLRTLVTKTPADTTETLVTIKKSFENYIANVSNQQNSVGVGTIGASGSMTDLDAADIHNHPPQNNMPIFSFNDLISFYDSYTYVKPSRKKIYTSYLVNFNGTTYALRMNDVSALDTLFAGLNIGTANATDANKEKARNKVKELYRDYGYKETETYNQSQSEKIFLKVINNPNYDDTNGSVYLKDISNIMNPYIGTWKWTSGNREMVLTLLKQTKYHYYVRTNNYYEDRLVGYYIYKENGIVIADTSTDNLQDDYGLNVQFDISCGGGIEAFSFEDTFRGTNYEVSLEMLSPTQMKFKGKIGEGTYPRPRNGTINYLSGTTFPLNMIFTKQ